MTRIPYAKPYLPLEEQVELLRARSMEIGDSHRALSCLHRVGYYRLSGYWYPFRLQEIRNDLKGDAYRVVGEQFRGGTRFEDVMALYVFDKKMRLLFMDAIERIEVGLRVEIALTLGRHGAFSHREAATFNAYFSKRDPDTGLVPHVEFLRKLDEAFLRSKEDFAVSYRRKYDSPMPIWMCIELWDFGTISAVLSGMKTEDLEKVAGRFSLPRYKLLISWAQSINFVRNVCAHHGRLWNRPPVQQPGPTRHGEVELLDHLAADEYAQRRLYGVAASLSYLLRTIHPDSTWNTRLIQHVEAFPEAAGISIRQMGFPNGWRDLPLWT